MNTSKHTLPKIAILLSLVAVMASGAAVPAFGQTPSGSPAPQEKRLVLNIPRGNSDGVEKFSIGAPAIAEKDTSAAASSSQGTFTLYGTEAMAPGRGVYTLKECVDIAVKNHLPLQTAKKSMKLAEMRLFEARRNMLPSATINFEEYSGRINDLRYIGRKQSVEGQQPVFRGGELLYTMKQSEVNLEITRNDYNRIRNELIFQVRKAYYNLAKAKGNLKMQQDLYKEVDRVLGMVTRQSQAQVVSKLEVLNVSSQAGQVKYQLASAEGDVSVAELILKQSMGLYGKDYVDVEEALEFKKIAIDYEKALSAAMVNRPEIRINSLMIEYYNYGKGIAKAKSWPKLDLVGSWGLAKEEYASGDLETDPTQSNASADQKMEQQWYAGIKSSLPIWGSTAEYSWTAEHWVPVVSTYRGTEAKTSSFKFKFLDKLDALSDRKLSEIDFDKARQELTKVRQELTLELRESCFNYQKALIQSETAANKVKYQAGDLELVKLKRGLEEAQDSNVVESMIKLSQEKFGVLQALADCHIALAGINKAIGQEDFYKDE